MWLLRPNASMITNTAGYLPSPSGLATKADIAPSGVVIWTVLDLTAIATSCAVTRVGCISNGPCSPLARPLCAVDTTPRGWVTKTPFPPPRETSVRREKTNYIIQSVSHALDVLEQFSGEHD